MNKLFIVISIFLLLCTEEVMGISYRVTDLGTLGGRYSVANGINEEGKVVGESTTVNGNRHAFLYSDGAMQDLGTLGGNQSVAMGINNGNQITGYAYTTDGNYRAFIYSNGSMRDIGTLGGAGSAAYQINDNGQVVGFSQKEIGGSNFAFLYSNGSMRQIVGPEGTYGSMAQGINNLGDVVGYIKTVSGDHAFLFRNDLMQYLPGYSANGINELGQVAGQSGENGPGCLFFDDKVQNLGGLTTFIVNDNCQAVGYGYNNGFYAFLYSDGLFMDLNTIVDGSGWRLECATSINNAGQIVGIGINPSGQEHAFILNVVPEKAIPESVSSLLLLFTVSCILIRQQRRQV